MSYEEGNNFDNSKVSYYNKCKMMTLFRLFLKNNELILNFLHGDLHKGNWKYREEDDKYFLVFYDFGFCWKVPDEMVSSLQKVDDAFLEIGIGEFNIDNFSDAIYHFLLKKIKYDVIKKSVKYFLDQNYDFQEPKILLKLMFYITNENNIILDSTLLQSLILYTQVMNNFKKYGVLIKDNNQLSLKSTALSTVYEGYLFSETYDIFHDYRQHIKSEIFGPEIINTETLQNIEEIINIDDIDYLKKLAIS